MKLEDIDWKPSIFLVFIPLLSGLILLFYGQTGLGYSSIAMGYTY
jgi:hypothetical protein